MSSIRPDFGIFFCVSGAVPGPGCCLYFLRGGDTVVLLSRGDKDSHQRDVEGARRVVTDWR